MGLDVVDHPWISALIGVSHLIRLRFTWVTIQELNGNCTT